MPSLHFMRTIILLPFLSATLAHAAEPLDRFAPKEPEPMAKKKEGKPEPKPSAAKAKRGNEQAGIKLRGLVFVATKPQLRTGGVKAMDGVRIEGVPLIDRADFIQRMKNFIGQALSLDLVNAIALETARYFREHDHPVVSVVAPKQEITSGVVQFLVTEARLGTVRLTGNHHFRSDLFKVGLHPDDPILMNQLDADTSFYNRNPFRSVTAELSPGKHPGETDVTLDVKDKFPLRVFAGYDNSGVKSTGENKLFTGFNYGNVFGIGDEFSYQYSSSADFQQLLAHSASWTVPLPWHHIFQISGTYSESKPKTAAGAPQLNGTTWQLGAHYIIPLPPVHKFTHELNIGYDFKYTDNNLQFGGTQVFDTPIDISQFSIAYSAALPDKLGRTSLSIAGIWSPGGMGSNNNDAAFGMARSGSKANYFYATLALDRITRLPFGCSWSLNVKGQLASGNLQATEQFLLGGESTVRGYDELAAAGDQGILMRNEIYAPSFSAGRLVGCKKAQDQFQFLVFHDIGYTEVKHPLIGERKGTTLQSAGVGARWQIKDNLSAHFDYGWQIDDIGLKDKSRAHVGVTLSY